MLEEEPYCFAICYARRNQQETHGSMAAELAKPGNHAKRESIIYAMAADAIGLLVRSEYFREEEGWGRRRRGGSRGNEGWRLSWFEGVWPIDSTHNGTRHACII